MSARSTALFARSMAGVGTRGGTLLLCTNNPESTLSARLKRIAYGNLTPLSAELQPADLARDVAMTAQTTRPANRPDHTYRVRDVIAQRGESKPPPNEFGG